MKKALLIGLIVCVLAIGGIGAAFATGLNYKGMGALSTGKSWVPQANVDEIYWGLEVDDPKDNTPWINCVRLSFDKNLAKGTVIAVVLYDAGDTIIGFGKLTTTADPLDASANDTRVYVDGGVSVKDIYKVRVTVGEPYPKK